MIPSKSSLTSHRYQRIEESAAAVLPSICGESPLYVHARNWMAEMAAITPLTESITDEEGDWLAFPEQGLNLSLPAVRYLHAIAIDHPSRPSLALEIATHGEPRSISIAAIPVVSDLDDFATSLSRHPARPLTSEHYTAWRDRHLIRPTACPCCAEAAENRRKNPEASPLAAIFSSAISEGTLLHCHLNSKTFGFSQSFVPGNLLMSSGHIGLTGNDGGAMLEIDPGLCHSFTLHRRPIDAEPMTILRIFNSLGIAEVTIEAPGFEPYDEWLRLSRI